MIYSLLSDGRIPAEVFPEGFLSLSSVCSDDFNGRIGCKQPGNVIEFFVLDIGIQTPLSFSSVKNIPQCDAVAFQELYFFRILYWSFFPENTAHYIPEQIPRIAIVFLLPQ